MLLNYFVVVYNWQPPNPKLFVHSYTKNLRCAVWGKKLTKRCFESWICYERVHSLPFSYPGINQIDLQIQQLYNFLWERGGGWFLKSKALTPGKRRRKKKTKWKKLICKIKQKFVLIMWDPEIESNRSRHAICPSRRWKNPETLHSVWIKKRPPKT